jgi:hypothetical protein
MGCFIWVKGRKRPQILIFFAVIFMIQIEAFLEELSGKPEKQTFSGSPQEKYNSNSFSLASG